MPVAKSALWIILYSPPGYLKTTLAAALMRQLFKDTGRKSLYVDFDGSEEDIPQRGFFDVFDPTPPEGTTEAVSTQRVDAFERRAIEAVLEAKRTKPPAFVCDTVSNYGRNILLNLPRPAYKDGATDRRPWYGEAQTRVLQWAMRMPELQRQGTHVLWVCHETPPSEKGDKGGPEVVSAGLVKTVPGFSRLVLRVDTMALDAVSTGFILRGTTDGLYIVKDRLNAFPSQGIQITVRRTDAEGKDKSASQFEEECLAMGEKVWRTVFKALARRQGVTNGDSDKAVVTTTSATPAPPAPISTPPSK